MNDPQPQRSDSPWVGKSERRFLEQRRDPIEKVSRRLIHYIEGVLEEKGSFEWQDISRILHEELKREQSPATDDKQWTEVLEVLRQTLDTNPANYNPKALSSKNAHKLVKRLDDAHKAALAAEREKVRCELIKEVDYDYFETKQQLLSAQAAIAEARHLLIGLRFWLQGSLNCKSHVWEPDQRAAATEVLNDAIKIEHESVDLSVLERHDAEVRKPLVALLNECRPAVAYFAEAPHYSDLKDRIDAAIADARTDHASDKTKSP